MFAITNTLTVIINIANAAIGTLAVIADSHTSMTIRIEPSSSKHAIHQADIPNPRSVPQTLNPHPGD